MVWTGFVRPPWPICGPSAPKGRPRLKTMPRLTHAAARHTTSGVMKLTVPRSSSAPQRPQLDTRRAMSRITSMRSGRRFGQQPQRLDVARPGEDGRHRAALPHLEALPDALLRAHERDLVGELVGHRRGRLVAPAG